MAATPREGGMSERTLLEAALARLDDAALAVMRSEATDAEQHQILGCLVGAHSLLHALGRVDPAAVDELIQRAIDLGNQVARPKTNVKAGAKASTAGAVQWDRDEEMDRRVALHLIAVGLGAPLVEAVVGRVERGDRAVVAELGVAGERLWRRARVGPVAPVYEQLLRHGARLDQLARQAPAALRPDLLRLHAQTLGRAAHLAWFDLDQPGAAARHFAAAQRAARQAADAGDAGLLAGLRLEMSEQASYTGDPDQQQARTLGAAAAEHAAKAAPTALSVRLHTTRAAQLALRGNDEEARAALAAAGAALQQATPATPYPIMADCDAARLARAHGFVLLELGAFEEAAAQLRTALAAGVGYNRQAGLYADLAEIRAAQGEPEEAARLAAKALEVAVSVGSHQFQRRVLRPYGRLRQRFPQHPATRELGDQLRYAMAS